MDLEDGYDEGTHQKKCIHDGCLMIWMKMKDYIGWEELIRGKVVLIRKIIKEMVLKFILISKYLSLMY